MTDQTLTHFVGRTFHHRDFDAHDLADRKQVRGETVSVVIPARDEEATVGKVAGTLRRALVNEVGLVDEILVVDGDSRDATARAAAEAGVSVVRQSEVLPAAGNAPGKGEALWKGLAASCGDLVVFVDADIRDIGPRFVTGLVGPLLVHDTLQFVKAAYDRPIDLGDGLRPAGGGRVTELMARPLIATFWPQLSWLAQPLSGEYAGRRTLLEQLPFVQGFGVELALLVDIVERAGAEVIAQVDLDRRVHTNKPVAALAPMATEILQVALDRVAAQGRLVLADEPGDVLAQPVRDADGTLLLETARVAPAERPPLARWREQHDGA